MTTESPEPWGLVWLHPYSYGWQCAGDTVGRVGKGLKSDLWIDRAIAVGPWLLAEAFAQLMAWTPEYQQILRDQEQAKQPAKQQAKPQAASTGAGGAVQLVLPI